MEKTATLEGQSQAGRRLTAEVVFGGTTGESVAACIALVLCIVGLARKDGPLWTFSSSAASSAAVMAIGAALLLEGASIAVRFSDLIRQTSKGKLDIAELDAGITVESIGGLFGIVLGILAFLRWLPEFVIPAAVILFGGTLIVGSLVKIRLNTMEAEHAEQHPMAVRAVRDAVAGSAGVEVLFGLIAIVLGAVALQRAIETLESGVPSLVLSLASLLMISIVVLLRGSTLACKMFAIFRF